MPKANLEVGIIMGSILVSFLIRSETCNVQNPDIARTHVHTHKRTQTHTQTHIYSHACMQASSPARKDKHTYRFAHACTHARTHACRTISRQACLHLSIDAKHSYDNMPALLNPSETESSKLGCLSSSKNNKNKNLAFLKPPNYNNEKF